MFNTNNTFDSLIVGRPVLFNWAGVGFERKGRLFVPVVQAEMSFAKFYCSQDENSEWYQRMEDKMVEYFKSVAKKVSRREYPLDLVRARVTARRDSEELSDEVVG